MKILISLAFILSTMNIAFSAELKDVKVLSSTHSESGIELKLQIKDAPKDSYFLVEVVRTDPDAFNKLALAMKKLEKGSNFKLNLRIASFSASPSGSYYKSNGIIFSAGK